MDTREYLIEQEGQILEEISQYEENPVGSVSYVGKLVVRLEKVRAAIQQIYDMK